MSDSGDRRLKPEGSPGNNARPNSDMESLSFFAEFVLSAVQHAMSAAWAMLHALVEGSTLERQILRHTIHTRTVGKMCKAQNLLSILEVRTAIQGIALSKSWEQSHTSSQGLMSGLDTCSGPGLVELNCATLTLGTHVSSQLPPNVLCAKCPNRFMASCRLAAAIRLAKITSSSCAVISDQIARKMAKHTTVCRDQIKHRRITARRQQTLNPKP